MSTNARCPKCQSEINQTMQFCNECQEPVNRETMQIAGMSVRIFVSILIFVMGTAYIGLLIFGALFSVPREVLLLIWFVVLAATIYFLLNGGKKSYSEREELA